MRLSAFINKFLGTVDSDRLTSHSFEHTTLSWASSYGLDEPARTLLGHHELQGARVMAEYSRDMLTRPLQLYRSMLKNIRGDHFMPDESRTSRMLDLMKIQQGVMVGKDADAALKPVTADAQAKDHRLETNDEVVPTTPLEDAVSSARGSKRQGGDESENDSDSLASASSSSSDAGNDTAPEAECRSDFIEGPVLRNIKSHVVHKCSTVDGRTLCNRLTSTATFEFLAEGCSTLNARCSRCFKGQVITTPSAMAEALDEAKAKRFKRI